MKSETLKKIKFIVVWSLLSWAVMLPMLLNNYLMLGETAMFFSVMMNFVPTVTLFYIITLSFAMVSYIIKVERNYEMPLGAGVLRWAFILSCSVISSLYYGNFLIFRMNYMILMITELPIMVFSYWVGFEVTKRVVK